MQLPTYTGAKRRAVTGVKLGAVSSLDPERNPELGEPGPIANAVFDGPWLARLRPCDHEILHLWLGYDALGCVWEMTGDEKVHPFRRDKPSSPPKKVVR